MDEIQIFDNPEFGKVRTVVIDGEPMFCLIDICKALEIKNATDVAKRLDEDEVTRFNLGSQSGETNFVNESGLYSVILRSDKPSAKKFRKWVTSEVLPTIRKHGMYATDKVIDDILGNPDFGIELLTKLKEERSAREVAEKKVINLENENGLLSQKVLEWADRPLINSLIRTYAHYHMYDNFQKAWTDFKKELLYQHGINLNTRVTAYLNRTGKKTKPKTLDMLDDSELQMALSTAVALCRNNDVDISDIIEKKIS